MSKSTEGKIAIAALTFFALWLFVVLPFLYLPEKPLLCAEADKLSFWQRTSCDPIAYFTLWLMASTAVLGLATIGLWFATIRGARIAERALAEHERPWLFFSSAGIQLRDTHSQPRPPNQFYVELFWENVGRAPALIEGCDVKFIDKDILPEIPDYSNCVPLGTNRSVAVGTHFQTEKIGPNIPVNKDGKVIQYVMVGRMRYCELNGKSHETGFAIEIAQFMPAFVSCSNRAYEYYT
jgi:hypothetical protein